MILHGNAKSRNFQYDFAQDSTLGVIGQKNLDLHLGTFVQILGFWIRTIITPTSATNTATLSFGWVQTAANPALFSTTAFMLPTLVPAFIPGFPLSGVNLYAAPEEINFTSDVIMDVAVENLTAGHIIGTIWYQQTEI